MNYRGYRIAQVGARAWIMDDDFCVLTCASEEEAKAVIDDWIARWHETYQAASYGASATAVALLAVGEELQAIRLKDVKVASAGRCEFFHADYLVGRFNSEGDFVSDDGHHIAATIDNSNHPAWRDR